jgi:anaerobic ribonucleoside-triphosphate reductase activating protein
MNYAAIKNCDIANGPGVRVSLFVSGCRHRCKGCFNEVAWDFDYGEKFTEDTINSILEMLQPEYVKGLTLLGGEPFEPENQIALIDLLTQFRKTFSNKSIWCYSGFSFEEDLLPKALSSKENVMEMLSYIDVLVDGKFVEELKNPALRFRGSSNQNIIDVKSSLIQSQMVLLDGIWERKMGSNNIYE